MTQSGEKKLDILLHKCLGCTCEGGGGGGWGLGHKVPALISKIHIFATNTATVTKFGDFS